MPRHDGRYEATEDDVLWALRTRDPDPFGHNEMPATDFLVAVAIADRYGLRGPVGRVLKRNRLGELLDSMAGRGVLVARSEAEWSSLGRCPPSRSKLPLYTTKQRAEQWAGEGHCG